MDSDNSMDPMVVSFEEQKEDMIKDFIELKTEEIKLLNSEAQKEYENRKSNREQNLNLLKSRQNYKKTSLIITKCWQKIYNKKWIIGYETKNNSKMSGKSVNVLLKCENLDPFSYSMKIYKKTEKMVVDDDDLFENSPKDSEEPRNETDWVETNELNNETTVIVLIDVPPFSETLEYKISGILLFQRYENTYQESLPEIKLSVSDYNDDSFAVKTKDIISADTESYLSVLISGVANIVQMKIPDDVYRTLEILLQLDCLFTKVNIEGGRLYLFDGTSKSLEGSIVQVLTENSAKFITRDEEQFYFLLHHLHKSIPGVVIFNETCELTADINNMTLMTRPTQSFLTDAAPLDEASIKNFAHSLNKQLELLENTLKNYPLVRNKKEEKIQVPTKDYKKFRNKLNELEHDTDLLFLKIN